MFWLKKLCKQCGEKKYLDKDGYCKECIRKMDHECTYCNKGEDDSFIPGAIASAIIINNISSDNSKAEHIDNSDLFQGGSSGGGGAERSYEDEKSSCDCEDSCCGSSDSCGCGSDD